ncbi:MAG: hypothetical protein AAF913_11215, partial [Pseudomonadota bacterium]
CGANCEDQAGGGSEPRLDPGPFGPWQWLMRFADTGGAKAHSVFLARGECQRREVFDLPLGSWLRGLAPPSHSQAHLKWMH